jgi:nucleotide-binding universal stress UspA family protein
MPSIKRILFATDFSETSEPAQTRAVQLARSHDAELHVLNVQVASPTMFIPEHATAADVIEQTQKDEARRRMDQLIQNIGIPVVQEIRFAMRAAPAVAAYADEKGIDLIIIGSHGRTGVRKLIIGSEARDLTRSAKVSTLVVRSDGSGDDQPFRRVLAPVDFSEASTAALQQAAAIAAEAKAELIALHVLDEWLLPPYYPIRPEQIGREHAEEALASFLAEHPMQPEPTRAVVIGSPARAIVDTASERQADLIVMGSAGLSVWERFLLGSVTERVLGRAPCSVWIHRAD